MLDYISKPWLLDDTGHLKGQPRKDKAVGFCHNKKHVGYLSLKMMKQHKCVQRECNYFEKYENHQYWIDKKRRKAKKKLMKRGIYDSDEPLNISGTVHDSDYYDFIADSNTVTDEPEDIFDSDIEIATGDSIPVRYDDSD